MSTYLQLIMWLIAMLCGAILAVYIAYSSSLAQELKKMFFLTRTKERKWKWFIRPVMWVWSEIQDLFACPYCLSVWICSTINIGIFNMQVIEGILYGLLGIVFVELWQKLTLTLK